MSSLTEEQQRAFDLFCDGHSMALLGSAGTGKSYLIGKIVEHCKTVNQTVAVTATTGAAAALIKGCTVFKWSGIGLGDNTPSYYLETLRKRKQVIKTWKETDVLIIDEVSMMTAEIFALLHLLGQHFRRNKSQLLGGIQVILCGDFAQIRPVKSAKYIFETDMWKHYIGKSNTVFLTKLLRQRGDADFQELLTNLRMGTLTEKDKALLKTRTRVKPQPIEFDMGDGTTQQLEPTVLYYTNDMVDHVNSKRMQELMATGVETSTVTARDNAMNNRTRNAVKIDAKMMKVLDSAAPRTLELCVGATVMLTVNLSTADGLVNGSIGKIQSFDANGYPDVLFDNDVQCMIEPFRFEMTIPDKQLERYQVPLKLAWAITIHKSQGATLNGVVTDLRNVKRDEPALIYVALTRLRSLDNLYLEGIDWSLIGVDPKVKAFYDTLGCATVDNAADVAKRVMEMESCGLEPHNDALSI